MGMVIKKSHRKNQPFSWGDSFIIPIIILILLMKVLKAIKDFVKDYDDGYENLAEIGSFNKEKWVI